MTSLSERIAVRLQVNRSGIRRLSAVKSQDVVLFEVTRPASRTLDLAIPKVRDGSYFPSQRGVLRVVDGKSNDATMTRWPLSFTTRRSYTSSRRSTWRTQRCDCCEGNSRSVCTELDALKLSLPTLSCHSGSVQSGRE